MFNILISCTQLVEPAVHLFGYLIILLKKYYILQVGSYFNAIIARKEELSILPDSGRKKQQKDNFWPATNRTKNHIEAWFKDLAGSKPLMNLSKKAPNFNKKEEIFMMLTEFHVPMIRAAWFIKLSFAYTVAVSRCEK